MIACLLGSWRSDLFDLAGGNCCYCCCSVHTVADTCSSTGRPFASPQRGPSATFPHTGGASEWTCADPFAAKVQAWGGFGLEPEGSRPSEAWDTGVEDVSCADGLPSVDCRTVPGTAAGVVRPAASVVAEILRVAEAEGRPDPVTSFSAEPCAIACWASSRDTVSDTADGTLSTR